MASTDSHFASSSVSYLTPPSDSQTLRLPWDVFLSFRGPDTRTKFVSHLYDKLDGYKIRTFRDDPELRTGEVISESLIEAIQDSKTYVVVFSENYASSSWCLDELVEIYKCHKNMSRLVIGVYYNIDPSVVRHQTKSFKKDFEKHQTRFADKVDNWRRTLKEVAGLSGQSVPAERDESDIINEIVDVILREIKPKTLHVADYPVGLDSRVEDIIALLSSGSEGVIKIGIYGMGGVGKTTLAKALYNRLLVRRFEGSCFLAEVREASGRTNGLVSLQQQLINDFLRSKKKVEVHNVEEGINIAQRVCTAKVLVLIDDVDDIEQYQSLVGPFASGSIVIITTRDVEILDKIKVEPKFRYSVNVLDDAESLELFTLHAFGNAEADNTLKVLFKDILLLSGRLPLALKVFGSYLSTKTEEGWKAYIKRLQQNFNSTIEQKLVISLDALESDDLMLKKMFLDIACFFIGRKKKEVVQIMETYYSDVESNFDILKKRCLLTFNNRDELGMHDLLRDMGRQVARNKSPDNVGKHSRLWVSKDICYVLGKRKGTEEVEGIIPGNFHYHDALEGVTFTAEAFTTMSSLRFLYLKNVKLSGSFEGTLENLRWFGWECCPLEHLPSDFCPEKLVTLALRGSKMRRMWEINMVKVPEVFEKLTTLDMSYSVDLIMTPDFSKFPHVETLNFEGCKSLEEVHVSIGSLASLVSLNLSDCVNLKSLPDSICNLKTLTSLNIGGCSTLLGSITEVNAWGLIVWKLPNSIGHLSKLVELNPRDSHHFSETLSYAAPTRWDVFLCFSDLDTRETFSNRLYQALHSRSISIYMDNPEVRSRGKAISHIFPRAIKEFKTCVVVISKDYAFSERCLEELTEILNCRRTSRQRHVIPVFYNIYPSEVRHQTGRFEEAFRKHQIRYAGQVEKVNEWRHSLYEVACLQGYPVDINRDDESYAINSIVDVILLQVKPRTLDVAKYTVGLVSRVKELTTLLSSNTNYVIKIGIYGMGGVGKTTLAKLLYNQLLLEGSFEHSSFLAGVREASLRANGLVSLLQQFIDDVLGKGKVEVHNIEEGIHLIQTRICLGKLLFLFDDVDHIKQYESLVGPFARGSVVIITTRNEEILDRIEVKPKYRYRVNVLDDADSLALFSQHAFGDDKPNNTLMALSKDILRHAGGLPLALEVHGSHLYRKSEVRWKSYIEKLQRIPNSIIQESLIICFNALLDWDIKEMFVDIACFFIGRKKEDVVRIMGTYYHYANHMIETLMKRCLLTINNRDELGMHNLLRDMGRDIVRNFAEEPGKHSRLWELEDIMDVLKKVKGTEAIEGIMLHYLDHQDSLEGLSFDAGAFRRMIRLRFLYLKNVNLTGSFEQRFEELRWLCWEGCPLKCLPSEFHPRKLVILELPHSKMTTMWEQNTAPGVFDKLTTLDMSYSLDLTTPDFSKFPCLESLILEGCKSLKEVHISIGSLLRLVYLNLKYCCNVTSLSNLKQLEFLNVTGCRGLTEIQGLEKLTSLKELHLGGCRSSLLAHILTKRFFQIYSGFGHQINIYIQAVEFPGWIRQSLDWIRQSSETGSTVSFNMPPNVSHNFLAMILCFKHWGIVTYSKTTYSVKNTTSAFIWTGSFDNNHREAIIVIVPRSIFSLEDGDERIELTANAEILGIHLLRRTEITMIDQSHSPKNRFWIRSGAIFLSFVLSLYCAAQYKRNTKERKRVIKR